VRSEITGGCDAVREPEVHGELRGMTTLPPREWDRSTVSPRERLNQLLDYLGNDPRPSPDALHIAHLIALHSIGSRCRLSPQELATKGDVSVEMVTRGIAELQDLGYIVRPNDLPRIASPASYYDQRPWERERLRWERLRKHVEASIWQRDGGSHEMSNLRLLCARCNSASAHYSDQ
jgi:hypothetical protein